MIEKYHAADLADTIPLLFLALCLKTGCLQKCPISFLLFNTTMVIQNVNLPIAFLFMDTFRAFYFTWVPQPKRKRSLSDLFI